MRGPLKTALLPLQKAIYSRLSNDSIIKSMVSGVYDEVKEGALLPYIQIGNDTVTPYDTKLDYGENTTLTINVYSAGPGKTESKVIMDAILSALTAAPIILTGFIVEGIEREFLEVFKDDQHYHGVCRFRVYTKQI